MKASSVFILRALLLLTAFCCFGQPSAKEVSDSWIDMATGHRIIRLADDENSASLYFHQKGMTNPGEWIILTSPRSIFAVNLSTKQRRTIYIWNKVQERPSAVVVAATSGNVYYIAQSRVFVTNVFTLQSRIVAHLPAEWAAVSSLTVNSTETLIVGNYTTGVANIKSRFERRRWLNEVSKMATEGLLYSINIRNGDISIFFKDHFWIDHPQFSPSDPHLVMFNYQVPPTSDIDNTWLIRTDGSGLRMVHNRENHGEALIHSFWNSDGSIIWYDLQVPWGRKFYIGGFHLDSGAKIIYAIRPSEWSYHYNNSPDGKSFAGDGNPLFPDGKWIYLFRIEGNGVRAERLVNLSKHDYTLEPNVQFTPDGKWIIFRANFEGAMHPYAVSVNKDVGRN
jgi:oligogalacturonide lyase